MQYHGQHKGRGLRETGQGLWRDLVPKAPLTLGTHRTTPSCAVELYRDSDTGFYLMYQERAILGMCERTASREGF